MSRSKRNAPIFPPARVGSERKDKKTWHARYRALLKKRLDNGLNSEIDEVDARCSVAMPHLADKFLVGTV